MLDSVSHTEWSGLLFYKFNGDVEHIERMSFELVALYPLDIGSSAYTEYTMNQHMSDVMSLYEQHPEYMDCKVGHIHSHHSMGVFASGTDMDTLLNSVTKGPFDMLLSVIVNNAREMFAAASYTVNVITTGTRTYKLEFDGKSVENSTEISESYKDVAWTKCECNLSRLNVTENTLSHIANKLRQIISSKRTTTHQINTNISDSALMREAASFGRRQSSIAFPDDAVKPTGKQVLISEFTEKDAYIFLKDLYKMDEAVKNEDSLLKYLSKTPKRRFDVTLDMYVATIYRNIAFENGLLVDTCIEVALMLTETLEAIPRVPHKAMDNFTSLCDDVNAILISYEQPTVRT